MTFTLRLLGTAVLDGPNGPVAGRAALRQRIALLALLAVEHPRPLTRDSVVALLWPESDTADARHRLRDSLYLLRSALDDDAVLSTGDDLRLNPARLGCDLWEFEAALGRGDTGAAVAIYHGPFLEGFHLSAAEEFEHWAEGQRSLLARRYGEALEQLAEREMKEGNPVQAAEWWSRRASTDPYNSRIALLYMKALEAAGDRAGALRHAGAHSEVLRRELNAAPEREVLAFAERLRLASRPASDPGSSPTASVSSPAPSDVVAGSVPPRPAARRRWLVPAAIVTTALVALGVARGSLSHVRSPVLEPQRVAAAPFENRTGRRDLDDLGAMAADWMIRGLMETPMVDPAELEAVYTGARTGAGPASDPLTAARRNGAATLIRGSYYGSGDSVLFQARIEDVASGRVLTSFEPVGAPVAQATLALEALRERVSGGLSPLVNALNRGYPIAPDLVLPRSLFAYREFIAGVNAWRIDDWDNEAEHYRQAARLDSTFIAPLIQLAYRALWNDQCSVTDSVARVLEPRRKELSPWNRMTIDLLCARCAGRMAEAVDLLGQRYTAYPRSASARAHYVQGLQFSNQPRAARTILLEMNPVHDMGWWNSPVSVWPRYWFRMAATWHMVGGYRQELEITDRWADSTDGAWAIVRGRALAAMGREREVLVLANSMAARSVDSVAQASLTIADELAAHGHSAAARVVAESTLTRFERSPDSAWTRAEKVAWAERLLGHAPEERIALEQIARSDADTLTKLEGSGRLAVLLGDTARAERIDKSLAALSTEPLENPRLRAEQILARARIAAGLGRREQAVAFLREAAARGMVELGASHAFHADPLLAGLRGYPPFDALLVPDN